MWIKSYQNLFLFIQTFVFIGRVSVDNQLSKSSSNIHYKELTESQIVNVLAACVRLNRDSEQYFSVQVSK